MAAGEEPESSTPSTDGVAQRVVGRSRERGTPSREPYGIIAILGAGGDLAAVGTVLADLTVRLPVPVVVFQPRAVARPEMLPGIIARVTHLTVGVTREHRPLSAGAVYVAPFGRHAVLRLRDGLYLRSVDAAGTRITASPFSSSLYSVDAPALTVVLAGARGATAEVAAVARSSGGLVIAEENTDAMPSANAPHPGADYSVPLRRLALLVNALVAAGDGAPLKGDRPVIRDLSRE
jgi:two-component system chemotaxis response regulator CheB